MTIAQSAQAFEEAGAVPADREERRAVTLAAYATREDGALVEMTVVDLSYDGCGIICTAPLTVGERLKLSVIRRGEVPVTVRWVDGARAGLSFDPVIATDEPARQPRRHVRISVDGEIMASRKYRPVATVKVYDLTPEGCRAEFRDVPAMREQMWIKFDGIEALGAQVCWIEGAKVGLKFYRTLHPAVFDLLIARLKGEA
jgi:hypothetical protein